MPISKYLDPKTDIAFKRVFGNEKNKNILMHFLNDLNIFGNDRTIVDVTFLSPIQDPEIASKKQSIVDVLCKDQDGVQYIVEMQLADDANFIKRAQYYASKAYFSQLDSGKTYKNLKEVVFLAITNFVMFKDKKSYISHHVILDKDTNEHDLKDLYFSFIELPKFTKSIGDKLDNMIEKWCYFLKHAPATKNEDLQAIIGRDEVIKQAYDVIERFNWNEEELRKYEQEIKREMDNRSAMETIEIRIQEAKKSQQEAEKAKLEAEQKANKADAQAKIEVAKKMLKDKLPVQTIVKYTRLSEKEIMELKYRY